ncbi:MAG: lysylphosphatidylglycerol synthase transmembrane domain-containing protein [Thermodesulfobacteriota bacterium]
MDILDSCNTAAAEGRKKGRRLKNLLVAGGLLLAIYLIWSLGPGQIWAELSGGWWPAFIGVLGAYVLQQALGSLALWVLGTNRNGPGWKSTSLSSLTRTRYVGEVLNYAMPTGGIGGEPYKLFTLGRSEGTNPAFKALAAAKFLHVAAVGPFAFLIFTGALIEGLGGDSWRLTFLIMTGLMAVMTLFLWAIVLWSKVGRQLLGGYYRVRRRVPRQLRGLRYFLHIDVAASKEIKGAPGRTFIAYLCYMGMWFAAALEWMAISHVMGSEGHTLGIIGAGLFECATIIVAALIPVPAGMGTQETGKAAVALLLGLPPHSGVTMSLIRRGREALMVLTGAALALAITGKDHPPRGMR